MRKIAGTGRKRACTAFWMKFWKKIRQQSSPVMRSAAGIVPVDADDRLWREMTGDACQYLAARAGTVFRVVCGIPVLLKGGEQ